VSLTAADILEALDESRELARDQEDLRNRYWLQHEAILSKIVELAESQCPGISTALLNVESRIAALDTQRTPSA
jgi:hypothetical protein